MTELALADLLVRALTGALDPAVAVAQVVRVTDAELRHTNQASLVPPPALLDGVVRVAQTWPVVREQALVALLGLCTGSPRAWHALVSSKALEMLPQLGRYVACALARSPDDPFARAGSVFIASALVHLASLPLSSFTSARYSPPVTPTSVAVSSVIASGTTDMIVPLITNAPSNGWDAVSDTQFTHFLEIACSVHGTGVLDLAAVLRRLQSGYSYVTPAAARFFNLCTNRPDGSQCVKTLSDRLGTEITAMAIAVEAPTAPIEPFDVPNMESAFALVKDLVHRLGRTANAITAMKMWLSSQAYELVAAGYIAAPKIMNRFVDGNTAVSKHVSKAPRWLVSSVDEAIDEALLQVLGGVPEMVQLFGTAIHGTGTAAGTTRAGELALKRAVLTHTALVQRRLDCICATGDALLHGLTDDNARYEPAAISALAVLLSVLLSLRSADAEESEKALDFCLSCLDLLLAEGRDTNGIPNVFADLACATMRLLDLYKGHARVRALLSALRTVQHAKGTDTRVSAAIEQIVDTSFCA